MTQKSLLHAVAAQIANGYETAEVPMYSEQLRMPDRKVIIKIIENLQKVFFPAYFAGGTVSHVSAETFAEFLLGEIYTDLCEQVHLAFSNTIKDEAELRERTSAVCDRFLCRLPQIQAMLMKDVAANFDGDPAAGSKEEVIFSYPGLYAIFVYRVAHELYESKVPLIPRIMSEYAHGATGIDINPGAQIGEYFFIDFSVENKTNIRFDIDEMRIKLSDKKQSKATNAQIVELTPSLVLDDAKTFKYGYRNVIVVKKMTFPNDKVLTIELSEKQISGRTISLSIDYEDVLSADSFNHILLEEE